MQMTKLFCADKLMVEIARYYASRFALTLLEERPDYGYWLEFSKERLALLSHNKHGAVYADFVGGIGQYRRKHGGGRGQLIARAIGLKGSSATPSVIDATAGLGRDALVLAGLGCKLVLIERSPLVAALLFDALRLAKLDEEAFSITKLMSLQHMDARQFLSLLPENDKPDVVYLDPMFPERNKKAAVKKEMQAFENVLGNDLDSGELLLAALRVAKNRVVVKRPRQGELLGGINPSFSLTGQSTRFDVYIVKAMQLNRSKLIV